MTKTTTTTDRSSRPHKDQIAAWKKEHGSVYQFTSEDGQILILRQPKMYDLEVALSSSKQKNAKPYDYHRSIVANCKLYEDEGMLSNDEVMLAIVDSIDDIIKIAHVEVKEL